MIAKRSLRVMLGKHVAPPRFVAFLVLLVIGLPAHHLVFANARWADSASMAFDLAGIVFLISLLPLLPRRGADAIRATADTNDANRLLVLGMTSLLTIAVMVTISGELSRAEHGDVAAIVKLIGTLLTIWLFFNSVYAMHYAHAYYASDDAGGDCGGLNFPGDEEPDYADFLYFSFTLGMTFQTSDVDVTSSRIRPVVLLQSFAAFAFNLGVIAFIINALGGAGGGGS